MGHSLVSSSWHSLSSWPQTCYSHPLSFQRIEDFSWWLYLKEQQPALFKVKSTSGFQSTLGQGIFCIKGNCSLAVMYCFDPRSVTLVNVWKLTIDFHGNLFIPSSDRQHITMPFIKKEGIMCVFVGQMRDRSKDYRGFHTCKLKCNFYAWALVSVCAVSKQRGSGAEADVKLLTLGLNVFTAVWSVCLCSPSVWWMCAMCQRPDWYHKRRGRHTATSLVWC